MRISFNVTKAIILFIAIFILALIFTLIEDYPTFHPGYDILYYSGIIFKLMLKISGMLGLFVLACILFKKKIESLD